MLLDSFQALLDALQSNNRNKLTEGAGLEAEDAPVELAILSCFKLTLGLENDLNISDDSRFTTDRLLAGFSSTSLGPSPFISGSTMTLDVGLIETSLDENASTGLTAIFCFSTMPWLLLIAFSLVVSAKIGGTPIGGCLPVLRYIPYR